jgi:hypothetical protein
VIDDPMVVLAQTGYVALTGVRTYTFIASYPGEANRGYPVIVEQTSSGYRVDWEAAVQWRDQWLRQFIRNRPSEAGTFFVIMQRSRSFDEGIPDLEKKLCFKVQSAITGDPGVSVFIDKDQPLAQELDQSYTWGQAYTPAVELKWETSTSRPYLKLTRIIRPSWKRPQV